MRLEKDNDELKDENKNFMVAVIILAVLWFVTISAVGAYCLCTRCRRPKSPLQDLDGDLLENPVKRHRLNFGALREIAHVMMEDSREPIPTATSSHYDGNDNLAMTSFSNKKIDSEVPTSDASATKDTSVQQSRDSESRLSDGYSEGLTV